MSNINEIYYENIDEKLLTYEHKSGLTVKVVPKPGFVKKYAAISTNFGSIDSSFIAPGDKNITTVPDGVAHFLEHKLFEQEDGSVMDKFAALGSSPNAFTSFNMTAYLFSCTDKFNDNLELLLNYVQNPYLTEESIEKEKGVISQEIDMYEDNPGWQVYFSLLKGLYKNNPINRDIAGTRKTIAGIDKEILYKCYHTFYHPSNMVLSIAGDVNFDEVVSIVDKLVKVDKPAGKIERVYPGEPFEVNKAYTEKQMDVSLPLTYFGFKENGMNAKQCDYMKNEVMLKIAMELLIGKSSGLYNRLYNEGLINGEFSMDYSMESQYSFSIFGAETPQPDRVKENFLKEIDQIKKTGFKPEDFERIRRSLKGKHIKILDVVDRIVRTLMSNYFKGFNAFEYFEVYDKIDLAQMNEVFLKHFDEKYFCMSVIKPK